MAGNSTDPGRSVTSKVTAILMAFQGGAVLSLTEIAEIAKLPTSTAHRLAFELLAWRLLERTETGGYRIGLPLRIIGKDASRHDAANRARLMMRASPVLTELARTARTEVKLGILNGHEVVHLGRFGTAADKAAAEGAVEAAEPAYATAMGHALLAFSPTDVVNGALAEATRSPIPVPDNLRQTLSVIRVSQIAASPDGGSPDGASAVAMPVFSGGGRLAAAVELAVRAPGAELQAVTAALTVACRSLSRQLATQHAMRSAAHNGSGLQNGSGLHNGADTRRAAGA